LNYESYRTSMKSYLIEGIQPSGQWGMPTIFRSNANPNLLIPFDKAVSGKDHNGWVHFFIHDSRFSKLLKDPWRYLSVLAKYDGVVSPDRSVFWGYPLYRQLWSICQSREIGAWLQRNGIPVIPCVRWGKAETYSFAFDGIEPGGTVAVGTAGAMREKEAREVFEAGFGPMLDVVAPRRIVVYGSRNSAVFEEAEKRGVKIVQFDTETAKAFKKRSA
jgi:hypothetical protein